MATTGSMIVFFHHVQENAPFSAAECLRVIPVSQVDRTVPGTIVSENHVCSVTVDGRGYSCLIIEIDEDADADDMKGRLQQSLVQLDKKAKRWKNDLEMKLKVSAPAVEEKTAIAVTTPCLSKSASKSPSKVQTIPAATVESILDRDDNCDGMEVSDDLQTDNSPSMDNSTVTSKMSGGGSRAVHFRPGYRGRRVQPYYAEAPATGLTSRWPVTDTDRGKSSYLISDHPNQNGTSDPISFISANEKVAFNDWIAGSDLCDVPDATRTLEGNTIDSTTFFDVIKGNTGHTGKWLEAAKYVINSIYTVREFLAADFVFDHLHTPWNGKQGVERATPQELKLFAVIALVIHYRKINHIGYRDSMLRQLRGEWNLYRCQLRTAILAAVDSAILAAADAAILAAADAITTRGQAAATV